MGNSKIGTMDKKLSLGPLGVKPSPLDPKEGNVILVILHTFGRNALVTS